MAKKYTSINFNHIYDKTGTNNNTNSNTNNNNTSRNPSLSSSSFSSPSYSAVSSQNKHGKILVLTRPTPKPVTPHIHPPLTSPSPSQTQQHANQIKQDPDRTRSEAGPDAISLRPLGRTGTPTGSLIPTHVVNNEKDKDLPLISPKPDKFVPPHLRPGYVRREEGPGPEMVRPRRQGAVGSPVRYGEGGRPKSGGHDRMKRNGGSDVGILGRPGSSGSRPNSSG
ncbi:PREDICTED: serine/threonine-protein kinase phg2-like [Lupinus angustifolius]|uniref:serine/threonine-protein kinase phg2-like n=1 Tax=Lupinus angustifolius TaxID=3871 RepID=UPI00092E2287|nr:PREDICTED: serine/threonine-protein kinase phg2-like [Lupinus angustifolius]